MNIEIALEYQEVYKTHDFDFDNPLQADDSNSPRVFNDYQCKNCETILIECGPRFKPIYIIDSEFHYKSGKFSNIKISDYSSRTCSQIIMENILI